MLVTVNTSLIPPTPFKLFVRNNNTNQLARKCPAPEPPWLTNVLSNGCSLPLEDVIVQAGRHFSDKVNLDAFSPVTTRRQAATAMAWTIVSLLSPYVQVGRLYVNDPGDEDIKRLCSEILGVGIALEVLRRCKTIDGRTIVKRADGFDYEATRRGAVGQVLIEAKGTFNGVSASPHRRSIADKISKAAMPRGYDSAIGVIASLWTPEALRTFDVEICDPEGQTEHRREATVREIIRFYARRFDESTGNDEGTRLLFEVAADPKLFDVGASRILSQATRDDRKVYDVLWHNRLRIRRNGVEQEFWGRIWEARKVMLPLPIHRFRSLGPVRAFMGIDSAIFRFIRDRDFDALLHYTTPDEGNWHAEGKDFSAVFNVDEYGILVGLYEGDLPMNVEGEPLV